LLHAVSFEFDDINITAQHVMTQTAPLMAACLPLSFTTSSSKTIVVVKFRSTDVFMRRQVSEKASATGDMTIMMATFPQQMQGRIKMIMPA